MNSSFQSLKKNHKIGEMIKALLANPITLVPPVTITILRSWLADELIEVINENSYIPFAGINIDTRTLNNNTVIHEAFLPLEGKHFQGLALVPAAHKAGARVIFVSAKYKKAISDLAPEIVQDCAFVVVKANEPAYRIIAKYFIRLLGGFRVAVTGSAGKTSTKEMLVALFGNTKVGVYANYKNENNLIGIPKNIFQLQKNLFIFTKRIHVLIFELGMNVPGEIACLGEMVSPHLAVVTNILHSHIGNFSHRDDLVHAKGEVINHFVPYKTKNGFINPVFFLPQDIYGKELFIKKIKSAFYPVELREVTTTTTTSTLEFIRENHNINITTQLNITEHKRKTTITKKINGIQIFLGELVSLGVDIGKFFGLKQTEIISTLVDYYRSEQGEHGVKKSESRLQIVFDLVNNSKLGAKPGGPLIIDDSYNSNPDSLVKVLSHLIDLYRHNRVQLKLVLVLGDILELGVFEEQLYRELAEKINQSLAGAGLDVNTNQNSNGEPWIRFFFLGKGIKICYDNLKFKPKYHLEVEKYLGNSGEHSDKKIFSDFITQLKSVCDSNTLVFFKASHGVQFQSLVSDFIRAF